MMARYVWIQLVRKSSEALLSFNFSVLLTIVLGSLKRLAPQAVKEAAPKKQQIVVHELNEVPKSVEQIITIHREQHSFEAEEKHVYVPQVQVQERAAEVSQVSASAAEARQAEVIHNGPRVDDQEATKQ